MVEMKKYTRIETTGKRRGDFLDIYNVRLVSLERCIMVPEDEDDLDTDYRIETDKGVFLGTLYVSGSHLVLCIR